MGLSCTSVATSVSGRPHMGCAASASHHLASEQNLGSSPTHLSATSGTFFLFFNISSTKTIISSSEVVKDNLLFAVNDLSSSSGGEYSDTLQASYLCFCPFSQVRGLSISTEAAGRQRCAGVSSLSSLRPSPPLRSPLGLLLGLFAQLFPSLTAFIPDEQCSLLC